MDGDRYLMLSRALRYRRLRSLTPATVLVPSHKSTSPVSVPSALCALQYNIDHLSSTQYPLYVDRTDRTINLRSPSLPACALQEVYVHRAIRASTRWPVVPRAQGKEGNTIGSTPLRHRPLIPCTDNLKISSSNQNKRQHKEVEWVDFEIIKMDNHEKMVDNCAVEQSVGVGVYSRFHLATNKGTVTQKTGYRLTQIDHNVHHSKGVLSVYELQPHNPRDTQRYTDSITVQSIG